MKKVSISELPLNKRDDELKVKSVTSFVSGDKKISMGNVIYPAGVRSPKEGAKAHDAIEVTIILRGAMQLGTNEKVYEVKAGDVTVAEFGEAHYSNNNSGAECETIFISISDVK